MEKSKNTGLVVTIIILVVALLGTSGFIVYDKFINTTPNEKKEEKVEDNNKEDNTETEVSNDFSKYSNEITSFNKNNNIFKMYKLDECNISFVLTPNGDVYLTDINNNDYSEIEDKIVNIPNYQLYGEDVKGYKLDISNIISMGVYHLGNDGTSIAIFIKDNGDVYYINLGIITPETKLQNFMSKNINMDIIESKLKNIVKFDNPSGEAWEIYAIDINGNTYSSDDL